ncbi:MAG TPA: aminotransferase class IV [Verrucomicrobiae bacterium]
MIVFLNGQFVPEAEAMVSVLDRGFLYGDGLFETLLVRHGQPFRWLPHLERMRRGADFLGIRLPFSPDALLGFARELVRRNERRDGLLRVTLSRGVGARGYSPSGAEQPTLVMTLHPMPAWDSPEPPQWKLATASLRLPAHELLVQFKTCNKLAQVLARAEAEARGADEALLLNTEENVVEAASGNLFWIEGDTVCTPPVGSGILPGVTRGLVLELCRALGVATREASPGPAELLRAASVFLSLSGWGLVAASELDGQVLAQSPLVRQLQHAYARLVEEETRAGAVGCGER